MSSTAPRSFAATHADPSRGFIAVPRWFRETDFWRALRAAHRAVLDELYHRMARVPVIQKGTGIALARGQWAMSWEQLAQASGASVEQARATVRKAKAEGILQQGVAIYKTLTSTNPRCLFTWCDFDSYDLPEAEANKSTNRTPNRSTNKSSNRSTNSINTPLGNTPPENTTGEYVGGSVAPAPMPASDCEVEAGGEISSKPASNKLTDEAIRAIKGDATLHALAGYLLHGPQAVSTHPDTWTAMKPSRTHWCPATRNYGLPDADVNTSGLAGYVHFRLNSARVNNGQPIELFDIGKLAKLVQRLGENRRTQSEVVQIIDTISARWSDVLAGLPPWMTTPPLLDESVLTNAQVLESAKRVAAGLPPQHADRNNATITTPRKGKYDHLYV